MARRRAGAIALVAAVVLSAAFALAGAQRASARSVNPARNVAITRSMSNLRWYFTRTSCQHAPGGTRCEKAVLGALNHARSSLGQRHYVLPVGRGWTTMASNWAGGMASPLFAYYGWMYGDGLDANGTSNNVDCTVAHQRGCWSHRDNILRNYGRHTKLLLGVGYAKTRRGPSWTQLFQAYPVN